MSFHDFHGTDVGLTLLWPFDVPCLNQKRYQKVKDYLSPAGVPVTKKKHSGNKGDLIRRETLNINSVDGAYITF